MADRKQIPRQTIGNLIPPMDDYVYFESPAQFPFDPAAREFSLVNAGWLMDSAMLVYGDEAFIHGRVTRLKAELPAADVNIFKGTSTQALVLQTDQFAIVAFRGTRVEVIPDFIARMQGSRSVDDVERPASGKMPLLNWRDVVSDAKFVLGGDGIHTGFRQALDQAGVWDTITAHLQSLADRPVWFTGHSLGAALATIAASRYNAVQPIQGLYTFGSPRVGNGEFAGAVPQNTVRFVNNQDMVARVPPPIGGYKHVGTLKFIQPDGVIADDARGRDALTRRIGKSLTSLNQLVAKGLRAGVADPRGFVSRVRNLDVELPESRWSDHAPINYACRIWNAVGGN
ncbi:MAG: lipase family protein [Planctomycetia bacterium]|nr:lipase family protein [Planctomycetia bacterium]